MRYVKNSGDVYGGFVTWLSTVKINQRDKYHARTFPKSLEVYEKEVNKLLPEFTKEDIVNCLGNSLTMYSIKRFYDRSRLWIRYCQDNNLYDPVLTEEDIFNTFLYKVPQGAFKSSISAHQRFFAKSEIIHMIKEYMKHSDNYIVAVTIVLLWEGLTCDEIAELKLEDCDTETGTVFVNNRVVKLSSDYFVELLKKAKLQKSHTAMNGKVFKNLGTVYLMRGANISYINQPMSIVAIRTRFMENFTKTIGRKYLTAQDIQINGRYWRLYENELENGKSRFKDDGSIVNWYVEKQYEQYKEHVHSII